MTDTIKGYIRVFGDDIDTDQIYPGRYLDLTDLKDIASHAMEGAEPGFALTMNKPCIVVAGENFGCGSSREHAVITLKYAGVKAVVASSFGRIFFRNAINLGLPAIICPELNGAVQDNSVLEIDIDAALIKDTVSNLEYQTKRIPTSVKNILDIGGLVPFLRKELQKTQ